MEEVRCIIIRNIGRRHKTTQSWNKWRTYTLQICEKVMLSSLHGRRSQGDGGEQVPQNLERGGLFPQTLSCCKILSTRLLALQCRKMCFFATAGLL